MIESIKTALASWLRAEVFALVGEAMAGHDQEQADMLTEIEALKREKSHLLNDVSIMHDDVVAARRLAEALKGQVETLSNKLADANEEIKALVNDHMPSAQQVADCISRADMKRAFQSVDLSDLVKDAVSDHLDNIDLSSELGEQVENAISNNALPQSQVDEAIETCAATIAQEVVDNSDFLEKVVAALGKKLVGK